MLTNYGVRLVAFIAASVGLVEFVARFLSARSEAFWLLFPVIVLTGSFWLQLLPAPRLNTGNRVARTLTIAILALFPAIYYGFLVVATRSPWSWNEFVLSLYFFGVSFELSLLYAFMLAEKAVEGLKQQDDVRWHSSLVVLQRVVLYGLLIPYVFVVFAVHRPKLMPKPITGIPVAAAETVRFLSRDGSTSLHGVFLSRASASGTVLVCHGVGANHSDIEIIHQELYAAGFQVFTFDFRGHGLSEGHTITYGLNERLDVLGAYDACLARDDVDSDRCFALGVSMGGAALALALPEMPEIKAAVLDSAFADLRTMVDHQFRWLPGRARSPMIELARGIAWLETGADINELMPERAVSRLNVPLLVIHGSEDRIVPVEHARRLSKAGSAKLYIEPDAPHIGTAIFNGARYRQLVFDHFSGSIEPKTLGQNFELPETNQRRHFETD